MCRCSSKFSPRFRVIDNVRDGFDAERTWGQRQSDDVDTSILYCCYAASDVEEAVIGHGKVEGPFTEIDGLEIERDLADIAAPINKVYQQADSRTFGFACAALFE